nr:MAG TPA: hypothetical protein [Caudoviricetes sp.]
MGILCISEYLYFMRGEIVVYQLSEYYYKR